MRRPRRSSAAHINTNATLSIHGIPTGSDGSSSGTRAAAPERALVVMVSVEVCDVLPGMTEAGLNINVVAAGRPEAEKVTTLGNGPLAAAATVIVNVAKCRRRAPRS